MSTTACLRLAPVALLLAACSSDPVSVGADAGVVVDASGDAPAQDAARDAALCKLVAPYSTKNVPCNDCAQASCCAQVNACLGDTKCNDDYVNCILACPLLPGDAGPDAAGAAKDCVATCGVQFPVGKQEYDTAIGCVDAACKGQCG